MGCFVYRCKDRNPALDRRRFHPYQFDMSRASRSVIKALPNTLTLLRCGLAVWIGWLILSAARPSFTPFLVFLMVASTDFLDGWVARRFNAESAFGAFLDPIADKLLVGISLLALASVQAWSTILLIPALLIIARDLVATILRLIPGVSMPVSRLAKWKTALELTGIGGLLLALALASDMLWNGALIVVWIAAALSVYTLGLYLGAVLPDTKQPHR